MKIAGWHLLRLAAEADRDLCSAHVESIRRDPSTGRYLFVMGSHRGKRFVVIGVRGDKAAFFWTRRKTDLPSPDSFTPTESFNRLRGARLTAISVPKPDRWVRWDFEKPEKDTDATRAFSLIISWAGAAGNIRLLDGSNDRVLETAAPEKTVTVGQTFAPPDPPRLVDWRTLTFPEYESLRTENRDADPGDLCRRRLWGVDQALADVIDRRASETAAEHTTAGAHSALWTEFEVVMDLLRRAVDPQTPLYLPADQAGLGTLQFNAAGPAMQKYTSLATAMTAIDEVAGAQAGDSALRERLASVLRKHVQQTQRRVRAARQAIERAEKAEQMQRAADLLGSQRHQLRRGLKEVTLDDWETGEPVTIALDPTKTPQENIERAYNRARNAVKAGEHGHAELPRLEERLSRYEKFLAEVDDDATDMTRLEAIGDKLAIDDKPASARRKQERHLPYREFTISGIRVLVGRSSRDNDELTLRHTRPDDLFLHAQGVSGSHVILKRGDAATVFERPLIERAAGVAAYFSRAKHSGLV
ncbi:MAG TPA: NFACT family protein, partial [Acidobacteriota bacterium]|nr:NFACT family protein [Acidobacteriota bacterium]